MEPRNRVLSNSTLPYVIFFSFFKNNLGFLLCRMCCVLTHSNQSNATHWKMRHRNRNPYLYAPRMHCYHVRSSFPHSLRPSRSISQSRILGICLFNLFNTVAYTAQVSLTRHYNTSISTGLRNARDKFIFNFHCY